MNNKLGNILTFLLLFCILLIVTWKALPSHNPSTVHNQSTPEQIVRDLLFDGKTEIKFENPDHMFCLGIVESLSRYNKVYSIFTLDGLGKKTEVFNSGKSISWSTTDNACTVATSIGYK